MTITAPAASTAAMTSSSRTLPPGWMNALTPASSSTEMLSANGKKASDAQTAPPTGADGLLDREARRVDARLLARADADRRQAAREHDRVRVDVLGDTPREQQVAPLRLGGRLARSRPA